ncbi:uncharacterized protein LOC6562064 [Drosophila grimshawi]|uniref:GH10521 n=1 Tax=Drosophila grimshawi TaxID=7222 RepID=B4JDN8_DROGR|nr:uncharacterized protein LOC6562064 [Drosophila grimshawi]EDW03408.1 GH10521 [Drosophila grimshawi]
MGNAESSQPAHESAEEQPALSVGGATSSTTTTEPEDEPWWHKIEHENLILQQVPVDNSIKMEPEQHDKKESQKAEQAATATTTPEDDLSMEQFKEQLATKRLSRQTAVQDLRDELTNLRQQLASEQAENRKLRQRQQREDKKEEELDESPTSTTNPEEAEVDTDDENPSSRSRHANIELANAQLALQLANAENLSLRGELDVVQRQVGTLKEVICCCKQMLSVKEEQCAQLKMKLEQIENSFSEREMKIMSNNLRQEYERQLVNIRQLRQLYEERQRVAAAEYENLQRLISIKRDELTAEQEKTKSFEERNQMLLKELETANDELAKLREECNEHKYEKRALKEQVSAVNLVFSQLVMGFNGKNNLDIDRLTEMLEENRDLLNEMTQAEGSCSDGASLPKLLFELVEQAAKSEKEEEKDKEMDEDENEESDKSRSATPTPDHTNSDVGEDSTDCARHEPSGRKHRRRSGGATAGVASLKSHEPEIMGKVAMAQEIIGNLPKVWKVLMELLSHHKIERVQFEEQPAVAAAASEPSHNMATGATTATPTTTTAATAAAGTRATSTTTTTSAAGKTPELSVSKTYIKLKDLIMEKKSLVKETTRLKTLNCHLDYRLNEQEKRLSAVSLELTKTWHLVGKMQRQHRQLHTQEQILRYQLQQKRRLLTELKDELEYCRRKWAAARAKNDESQEQCNDWRREFARRKLEDAHHSAESGYSDSGPQSDEDTSAAADGGTTAIVSDQLEVASSSVHCRRKYLRDQFEHTRKIKRMQSTSPGRQAAAAAAATGTAAADEEDYTEEITLRWNSAPPTCGWRQVNEEFELDADVLAATTRGAVPKTMHSSRSRQRGKVVPTATTSPSPTTADAGTASRIQKLEAQCQSLIQQVLETSDNRERLEIQLCRFQDDMAPVQHAVPLDEYINRKRLERMTRASSAPAAGCLTPREEEYTRKRSERLGRLEEESRQLLQRIKRTTDRGHYLKKSLDRIRRAPSPEASSEEEPTKTSSPLTEQEESYTSRRAARLQRMEQESQQLLQQLARNTERGDTLTHKLDTLHERHGSPSEQTPMETPTVASISQTVEQRLEDIERVSANRAERLRRMELEGNELIARLSHTSERGTAMINRIAEREATKRQEAEVLESVLEQQTSSNNIASTVEPASEAACSATITTTASQLALQLQSTGAIPKTVTSNRPQARTQPALMQLCATVRHEDANKKKLRDTTESEKVKDVPRMQVESLEDMVQRLRALPFPAEAQNGMEQQTVEEQEKVKEVKEMEQHAVEEQEKVEESKEQEMDPQAVDEQQKLENLKEQLKEEQEGN